MKALVLHQLNHWPVFEDIDRPVLQKGHVPVAISAAALNHRDIWICKGQYAQIELPAILGSDGVGHLDNGDRVLINPSVNWLRGASAQPSDYRVLGMPDQGTFAEVIHVAKKNVQPVPTHLNDASAAALPLAGLTAWRVLFSRCKLQTGERVFITGIGGGVALMALQLALAAGAEVWVSSGNDAKIQKAIGMGAQGGVNYSHAHWFKDPVLPRQGFDVVVDGAGGGDFDKIMRLCAPGARVGIYGGTRGTWAGISPQFVFWKQISILGSTMGNNIEFAQMLKFVERHQITPIVDCIFDAAGGHEAFEYLSAGGQFGKVVLRFK
jgi:NADPH:quinone reductase-like Zn-dependent oxidoreductase